MITINTTDKYLKLDLSFQHKGLSKNIVVAFERPIIMQLWYRVFRKPSGRYVALSDMVIKPGWNFIGSVNLAELYPGSVIL